MRLFTDGSWVMEFLPRGNCNHRLENGRLQMGCFKTGHFEMPVSYVLNFRGWIKLIFDTVN